MTNEHIKVGAGATRKYEDILPEVFQKYNETNRKIYKQAMTATVLLDMKYDFDSVSVNEFFKLPLLNKPSEDLIYSWRSKKHNYSFGYPDYNFVLVSRDSYERDVLLDIIILLSVIYAEIFYLIEENNLSYDYAKSVEMQSFFQQLLNLEENRETYSKLTGLGKLIVKSEEQVREMFIKDYFDNLSVFVKIMETPHLARTVRLLKERFQSGKKVKRIAIAFHSEVFLNDYLCENRCSFNKYQEMLDSRVY